jgi:uncharacterized protein affecting Mg2+/Co2+ transport
MKPVKLYQHCGGDMLLYCCAAKQYMPGQSTPQQSTAVHNYNWTLAIGEHSTEEVQLQSKQTLQDWSITIQHH